MSHPPTLDPLPPLATLDEEQLPLLITGVSGVAGLSAFHHLRHRFPGRVIGIRPEATWRLDGDGIVALNTEDRDGMEALFREHRFRSVLNTTGNCALKACELDPDLAHRTNVSSARNIGEASRRHGCRLVHMSIDLVFSGTRPGDYTEADPVDPVTVYGKTMAEGEEVIASLDPDAPILRISLPMGPSFNRHAGAIDWIQSRFRNDRPATLYFDEVRTPTYVDDLNRVFEHFLARPLAGLFHTGGPRKMSLYNIAQVINRVGGYDPDLLIGIPRIEAGPMPPRAGNVTMTCSKLIETLGGNPFRPWPLGEDIVPTSREWHSARPDGEHNGITRQRERLYRYPGIDPEAVIGPLP